MSLTRAKIETLSYKGNGKSRFIVWDDHVPNFGLRVFPSSQKSFVLRYWINGRERLISIGRYPVLSLIAARNEATVLLGKIARGEDPLSATPKPEREITFGEFADVFIERHSKVHKKTWLADVRRNRDYLADFQASPISSITFSKVTSAHLEMGRRSKYEANRSLELLRTMFEKAKQWGYLDRNALNPAKGFKRFKELKRERFLTQQELPRLVAAIDTLDNIYLKAAIWLLLLTALRKSELLKLKWNDVDLDARTLFLADTKSGNNHTVFLSQPAIEILNSIPRLEGNEYLLPGKIPDAHLTTLANAWNRVRRLASIEDVRLHDLRRTLGSIMAQNGASLHLIGTVLNHRSTETTKIYSRFARPQIREAMQDYSQKLLAQSGLGSTRFSLMDRGLSPTEELSCEGAASLNENQRS